MLSNSKILTNDDLIEKSKQKLESSIFDFISGGAGSEWGLLNNLRAFQQYQIVPRVLQKVKTVDCGANILGEKISAPIIIAPCAFHKLVCEEGEVVTARAAAKADTIFTVSTMSTCSIEEISMAADIKKWFQLYLFKDKEITKELVARAEEAGYTALVVTVDVPAMGMRMRDIRNTFSLPKGIEPVNFKKFGLSALSDKTDGSKIKEHTDRQFDADLGWDVIAWLRSITKLPIILKGILHPDDALQAVRQKVDGIIVSNHGGRQIDSVISPLDALLEITHLVANKVPIIVDGGIRNGEDIFKALALGADAVMLGRPVLWALSVGGENELISLFNRLQNELKLTMQLSGCKNLREIKERGLSLLGGANINAYRLMELTRKLDGSNIAHEEKLNLMAGARFF